MRLGAEAAWFSGSRGHGKPKPALQRPVCQPHQPASAAQPGSVEQGLQHCGAGGIAEGPRRFRSRRRAEDPEHKRDPGLPPFAAYDRHRLELARDALRDSAMSVKEIAFELGFNSPPHFSNWFPRRQGCAPRAFRARG